MDGAQPQRFMLDESAAAAVETRLQDLRSHLDQCRHTLTQLDAQRAQVQTALLRLEGAIGVLQELLHTSG